jgi:hypothetical protein
MHANVFITKDYENETAFRPKKTNPNKPNSNPILIGAVLGTPYGGLLTDLKISVTVQSRHR